MGGVLREPTQSRAPGEVVFGEGGGGRDGAVRGVLWRACAYGVTISSGLALFTLANVNNVVNGLTTDAAVRAAAAKVLPLVLVCQA